MGAACDRAGAAEVEQVTTAGAEAAPEASGPLGQVAAAAPPEASEAARAEVAAAAPREAPEASRAEVVELDQGSEDFSGEPLLAEVSMSSQAPPDVETRGLSFFPTPVEAQPDSKVRQREVTLTRQVRNGVAVGLGIGIRHVAHGKQLRIDDITDGVIKQWNQNNPDDAIEEASLIMAVNGVTSSSKAMLEEIKSEAETLRLVLRRPSGKAASRQNRKLPSWSLNYTSSVAVDS